MADVAHPPVTARTRRLLAILLVTLVLATVAGAIALWPTGSGVDLRRAGDALDATVVAASAGPCTDTAPEAGIRCVRIEVLVEGGGRVALEEEAEGEAGSLAAGDRIVVHRHVEAGAATYRLSGRERSGALTALLVGVAVVVLVVARWRGMRLLAGLAAAAVVLTAFTVPALLHGAEPVAAALVGAALVAICLAFLGHGVNVRTATAVVGALLGLGAAGLAAQLITEAAELAELGGGPAFLEVESGSLPVRGLLLAGLLVGTVGGLVDLALRQVDATWNLTEAAPGARWFGVTRAGLRRGRAHVTAVGGTVVLAYAGAALPVLILLTAGDQTVLDAVQGEVVAVELVRALVAVLALAVTAPLTASVAAAVVIGEARRPAAGDPRRFRSRHERHLWDDDAR